MKRRLALPLKFALYSLALCAVLLPLARLLHKAPHEEWFEETFLYI